MIARFEFILALFHSFLFTFTYLFLGFLLLTRLYNAFLLHLLLAIGSTGRIFWAWFNGCVVIENIFGSISALNVIAVASNKFNVGGANRR